MKIKKFLTDEILERLSGFIDVFNFILNLPYIPPEMRLCLYSGGPHLPSFQIIERRSNKNKNWAERKIAKAIAELKRRGYIIKRKIKGQDKYFLSRKGIEKILRIKLKEKMLLKKNKLQNKYLVIVFDVPEKIRHRRNFFRKILKNLKFEQLQKSVWIAPLDFSKELLTLTKFYGLDRYVKFLIAQKVDKKGIINL